MFSHFRYGNGSVCWEPNIIWPKIGLGGGIAASLAIWIDMIYILYIHVMIYLGFRASPISYKHHEPNREQFHPSPCDFPKAIFLHRFPSLLGNSCWHCRIACKPQTSLGECLANHTEKNPSPGKIGRLVGKSRTSHFIPGDSDSESSPGLVHVTFQWAKIIIGIPRMIYN